MLDSFFYTYQKADKANVTKEHCLQNTLCSCVLLIEKKCWQKVGKLESASGNKFHLRGEEREGSLLTNHNPPTTFLGGGGSPSKSTIA